MLCACSGEQFKFDEPQQSPESLATRDFSASGLSSRTVGDWESKLEDIHVDEAESTLKEALSLNYEEARALLGRLEYQRGNLDAALQVFQGIDIKALTPKMIKAIVERIHYRKSRSKGEIVPPSVMSMHSVSLFVEAILLKANSLEELGHHREAAKECRIILNIVESALPNGMPKGIGEDCKLEEMFHKALELLPALWSKAGLLDEAIASYRRALVRPCNLDPHNLAGVQKELASMLLYSAVEARHPPPASPQSNIEEAILLLLVLMSKVACGEIKWDEEIMDHLTYALSIVGQFDAAGQNEAALNLLKKVSGYSESKNKPHIPSFLLGAKLCSQDPTHAQEGINFALKVLDLADHQNQHFIGQTHKFLGICYGNAARVSLSDSERFLLHTESMNSLNNAALNRNEDPEVMYSLGLENMVQRNLGAAFDNAIVCSEMIAGNTVKGWKLLALVVSAEQRFRDAQTVVEFALDVAGRIEKLELLRLKAFLQIAQEQPKQAIETYRILLSLIQAQRDIQAKNPEQTHIFKSEVLAERNLELAAWQDLADIYTKNGSWGDAKICVDKAKLIEFHSPRSWHSKGMVFECQSLHKEALVSFSVSLSVEPDYVPSIVATAEVLMKLGTQSFPIARSFLMHALRLDPTNHEAWLNLGLISKMEGSLKQAAEFFQAAYELKLSAPILSAM
ncbi:PROTEIN NPGR1 [Salix koriyanagi]|uniref:PROTEIN NPGR1 n=1 Tax=Salix koriyanagi TaxID=2511006 RepID=A0A9Q0YT05_9ROSI|nr:PROTEIN NPGR1 [Salix koriyanagi]